MANFKPRTKEETLARRAAANGKARSKGIQKARAEGRIKTKWDWDLIKALYIHGMTAAEICRQPECDGLSEAYLRVQIHRFRWVEEKRVIASKVAQGIGDSLHDRRKTAIDKHYEFVLKELDDEKEIYKSRIKTTAFKDQQQRIALLDNIEQLGRRVLKLDDLPAGDKTKQGFNIMIQLQQPNLQAPTIARQVSSATLTLPDNKNATQGKYEAENGILEADIIKETPTNLQAKNPDNTFDDSPAPESDFIGNDKLTSQQDAGKASEDEVEALLSRYRIR
jgi:hypothetical protein